MELENGLDCSWTLKDFDASAMTGSRSDSSVAGQQRGVKQLCQRDINGVISRKRRPKVPNAREQKIVRVTTQGKIGKVVERFESTVLGNCFVADKTAQYLSYFEVQEMRGVKRL
jgi:hypothetical protein